MRRAWVVVVILSGCVRSDLLPCGEVTCPSDSVCLADQGRCVTQLALRACESKLEIDDCVVGTSTGKCVGGACTVVACGNGLVEPGELCDDGNRDSGDQCSFDCRSTELCGNGYVDFVVLEECDDGNAQDGDDCEHDCKLPRCGDHILNPPAGEVCDDGNRADGDGCSRDCMSTESCGNGVRDPGEECDDGNAIDHDGCQSNCRVQRCGDGVVDSGEQCDDGNFNNNDACLNTCLPASCGDGFVYAAGDEICDDGNGIETDDCSSVCLPPRCGDGFVWAGHEECDDGNLNQLDCCKNDCSIPTCGDGIRQCLEKCDDGGSNGIVCRDNCTTRCPVPGLGIDTSDLILSGLTRWNTAAGEVALAIRGSYVDYGGAGYGGLFYGFTGYVTDLSNDRQIRVTNENFAEASVRGGGLQPLGFTGFGWDGQLHAAWFGTASFCSPDGQGTLRPSVTVTVQNACGDVVTAPLWSPAFIPELTAGDWPTCP